MQSIIKHTHIYDDSELIYMIQIIVDRESAIWSLNLRWHHVIVNPVCIVNINVSHYFERKHIWSYFIVFSGYPEITFLLCKYMLIIVYYNHVIYMLATVNEI